MSCNPMFHSSMSRDHRTILALFICFIVLFQAPMITLLSASPIPFPQDDADTTEYEEPGEPYGEQNPEWSQIFEELFGNPYDPAYWNYQLDNIVETEGLTTGKNQYDQSFELEVVIATPIMLEDIPLAAEDLEVLSSVDMSMCGVVGYMHGDKSTIPVTGMAVSQLDSNQEMVSIFVVSGKLDPESALLNPTPLIYDTPPHVEANPLGIEICFPWPEYCVDAACIAACEATRQAAIDAAEAAYATAVQNANTTKTASITAAETAYNLAITIADNNYNGAVATAANNLATCSAQVASQLAWSIGACAVVAVATWWLPFLGSAATVACIAAATGISLSQQSACDIAHAGEIGNANIARQTAKANAQAAKDSAVAAAEAIYKAALDAAKTAKDAALAAAEAAFEACIAGCPKIICGIRWICFTIWGGK